jgi:hypothetical protein
VVRLGLHFAGEGNRMKLITDSTELAKAITAWGKSGSQWAKRGHELACSALARFAEHNDIGPVNRLFLAMPKGTKSTSMTLWLLTFGALTVNPDTKAKKTSPFVFDKTRTTNLEGAQKSPWYDFKPDPAEPEAYDLVAAIKAIITKAEKAPEVLGSGHLATLKAMVGEDKPAGDDSDEEGSPEGAPEGTPANADAALAL